MFIINIFNKKPQDFEFLEALEVFETLHFSVISSLYEDL